MINYLKGRITVIKAEYIVLEAGGIGYTLKTPNPFAFVINEETTVYTYLHVREDLLELYGFKTEDERGLFLKLLSVKGIGPKGALAIVASGAIEKVYQAINNADSNYLQRFPGIGPKASQQIILDLRGKIKFMENGGTENETSRNVKEALRALGYNSQEIKAVEPLIQDNLNKPVNDLLKMILKKLY
ncbi:MAG TPA: Holliday junction branch migration protein RuvA [Bacilli bacterium]